MAIVLLATPSYQISSQEIHQVSAAQECHRGQDVCALHPKEGRMCVPHTQSITVLYNSIE